MGIAGFEAVHVWLQSHTFWLGPVIALVACLESLVAIGLLLPGVAMMFALGALAGGGAVNVYSILAWGVLGAVIGDGLSFLFGRHYHEQLRSWWPFSRHPDWLERGEDFFQRYGALSVALGRFIGPVRPVIPAVAGMMGMPSRVFFSVNLVSSVGWSPVYLLPGYMTGAALQFHEQMPDQLMLVVLVWFSLVMGISGLWVLLEKKKPVWSGCYPVLAGLLVTVLVVLNITGHLQPANHALNHWLVPLRLPWMEEVMAVVTWLGTVPVLGGLLLIFLGWQYRQGLLSGWVHLIWAVPAMVGSVRAGKLSINSPRPVEMDGLDPYSFPSGHTTMATFFLLWMAARMGRHFSQSEHPRGKEWLLYGAVSGVIMLVGFSRLVLEVHWLGDVLTGFSLGLFWVLLASKADSYFAHRA